MNDSPVEQLNEQLARERKAVSLTLIAIACEVNSEDIADDAVWYWACDVLGRPASAETRHRVTQLLREYELAKRNAESA